MLWEARYEAQIHVADELTNAVENSTLYSDGASKKGHSYATFDYQKPDGTIIVTGLRCVGGGDAQTQLDTFKEILSEISESSGNTDSSFISKTFFSIKNPMSDRCATQKKFNDLFEEYRSSVIPDVIDKWNTLTDVEQKNLNSINDFFCGLHFLVGLADQAEASIKLWEGLLIGDAKVGSLNHGSYSKGESGTLRLIRIVCKSVSEKGCEKSGRMVTFGTFLKEHYSMSEIPLYPFLGNRFKLLFLNGGGIFELYSKLKEFFDKIEKENKLLTSVYWDLHVLQFKVGCHCLGLIHKLVSGPLWRKMEKGKTALNMSYNYQNMLSSLFVKGQVGLFPEFISKDDMFSKLVEPDPEIDDSTIQCLELIFNSFVVVSERMLKDLEDGKYGNPTPELIQQSKSTATTNDVAERAFGMLGRLKKLKPKALDLTVEGMIMYQSNKTRDWRAKLSQEQLEKVMKNARFSKKIQRERYRERMVEIHKKLVEKMESKAKKKQDKELVTLFEKERLTE